jgi:hypothetical protein
VEGKEEVPRAGYDERDRKENGESSHLLFGETRLPLGEPGDVRQDKFLRRVGLRVRASFVRTVGRRRARPLGGCTHATKWVVIGPIKQLTT